MKLNFYAIFDKAIGAYMRPFVMQADGQAIRMFHDECVNADSPLSKHPEDYTLFRLGSFDDNEGEIVGQEAHKLARGHEIVAAERASVSALPSGTQG